MNNIRRRVLQAAMAAVPASLFGAKAFANQNAYPDKLIKLYVPFGPGSGSDVYARYFGKKLGDKIGQTIIVENKPGGGGAIAVQSTKSVAADGSIILLGSNSPMAVNVSVYKELTYDPQKDVVPICGLTRSMAVIVVPANSPIKSVEELVARGKQTPMLNMGTYSAGYQLAVAPFLEQAGFTWQDVPYKGLAQTTSDVIGNQLDVAVIDTPGTVQIIKSDKVRAIAVTGTQRHPELPDVPTLIEAGYKDAVHYSWTSLWVKSGTPKNIIDVLSGNMLDILNEPESKEFVLNTSGEIMPFGPDEMKAFQKQEIARFGRAVDTLKFERV